MGINGEIGCETYGVDSRELVPCFHLPDVHLTFHAIRPAHAPQQSEPALGSKGEPL
jgi:hypothetical protein